MPLLVSVLPTDLARSFGGGERCAVHLHRELRARLPGWDALALTAWSGPPRDGAPPGWNNVIGSRRVHSNDAIRMRALLHEAVRGADLVIAHQWRTRATATLRALHGAARGGTLVAVDHGGGSETGAWLDRLPLPAADIGAVQSEYERRVTPMRARSVINMRGGIVEGVFVPPERDERDLDFLMVGRFLPHKGQALFLDALPEGARARLMGPSGSDAPDYRDEVLRRAEQRGVEVVLDAGDADVVAAYQRAAYTVQVPVVPGPGVHPELLGLSVLEGMACGSVPICPRGGPSAEFVRDGETGLNYEAESRDDLARVLREALEAGRRRAELAAGALAESAHWTWGAAAAAILAKL